MPGTVTICKLNSDTEGIMHDVEKRLSTRESVCKCSKQIHQIYLQVQLFGCSLDHPLGYVKFATIRKVGGSVMLPYRQAAENW